MAYLSNENRKKNIEEIIKNFRPIDDTFLSLLIQSNYKVAEYILRVIMEMPSLKVLEVHSQDFTQNIFGRSARFDILAKDDEGKIYNIEIQRSDAGATLKRARFNSSILDIKGINSGDSWDKLNETYVIFITENDVLKDGLPIYHIERTIIETCKQFKDGEHIIYVSSSHQDLTTDLGRLMHDFYCSEASKMLSPIKEDVQKIKSSKEGIANMCEAMEQFEKEAISKGKAEGLAIGIKKGIKQGVEQGLEQGMSNAKNLFIDMLQKDFGFSYEDAVKKANEVINRKND